MRQNIPVPASTCRKAEALLDQQMWCWGCDVRREQGNLLLAYGGERHPAPNGRSSSAYHWHLPGGGSLVLWGWGIWTSCAGKGSLYLSRSPFRLRYGASVTEHPKAWCEKDLPPLPGPTGSQEQKQAVNLLVELTNWIEHYERWIAEITLPGYRPGTIEAWPRGRRYKGGVAAAEMGDAWERLARSFVLQPML